MGDTLLTLLFFSEAFDRECAAHDDSCTGEKFKALKMVPFSLRTSLPKKLGAQDKQTYIWATADVGTCGDNSRPSRDEVAALACTMLDSMWQENLSIRDERPRREDMFPVSQPLVHENFWCLIHSTHT